MRYGMGTHEGTAVTQTITYDAWGVPSVSGNNDSHLMWKGLVWEPDAVGLYYMRGRWYDPELGRFIQEDPIHSGVNDYVFANNDPINGSDPSGACPFEQMIIAIDTDTGNWTATCPRGGGSASGTLGVAQLPPVAVTAPAPAPAGPGNYGGNSFGSPEGSGLGGPVSGSPSQPTSLGQTPHPPQKGCPNVSLFERQLANGADRQSMKSGVEEGIAVVWGFIPIPVPGVKTPSSILPWLPWGTTAFIHNHPSGRGISEHDSIFAYVHDIRVVSGSARTRVYGSINPGGSRVTCQF